LGQYYYSYIADSRRKLGSFPSKATKGILVTFLSLTQNPQDFINSCSLSGQYKGVLEVLRPVPPRKCVNSVYRGPPTPRLSFHLGELSPRRPIRAVSLLPWSTESASPALTHWKVSPRRSGAPNGPELPSLTPTWAPTAWRGCTHLLPSLKGAILHFRS
jgi:hypothetical protein